MLPMAVVSPHKSRARKGERMDLIKNAKIFKGVSKKGNVYYTLNLNIVANGDIVKLSGLLYKATAEKLISEGVAVVDFCERLNIEGRGVM